MTLGCEFEQEIEQVGLPPNLNYLSFKGIPIQEINNGILPDSLKELTINVEVRKLFHYVPKNCKIIYF